MKSYYGVEQKYYDTGKVQVKIIKKQAEKKPSNSKQSFLDYDLYIDWFTDRGQAVKWKENALKA